MRVEVKDLSRRFGDLKAVDRASFSFESGEVYGFIGPNGAGKTTTLKILATLDVPTSGDVLFDGRSAVNYPDRVRSLLGFMPDTLDAYKDMTAREYVDFFARAYGLKGRERARRCAEIMAFTDLEPLAEKLTDTLSKGMKQRLSLARTLVHDPQVLLLDEPAAGLDPRARVELRELIRLLGERGKAILVSSHILTELSEICNGVVIIEKGCILAEGRTSEVERKLRQSQRVAVELAQRGGQASGGEGGGKGSDALERFLVEQPGVADVRIVGSGADFEFTGTAADRAGLLGRMVGEGFLVGQYRVEEPDLEDIFLQITHGEVS